MEHVAGSPSPLILLVDDDPGVLAVMSAILQSRNYRVRAARSGTEALRAVEQSPPSLILLDVCMPGMDGHAVLARLKSMRETRDIPVIFVTGQDAQEDEEKGLALGAVDYIIKPCRPAILLLRVGNQLALKAAHDALEARVAERTRDLDAALARSTEARTRLHRAYAGTLQALGALAELRHPAIGQHARRVAEASRQVAVKMALSVEEAQTAFVAGLLHDVGRAAFPDALLAKSPADMNREELARYHQHGVEAGKVLARSPELQHVARIVRHHHEHFDGSGFPDGLAGTAIPVAARIIAAVSDYDDLRTGAMTGTPLSADAALPLLAHGRHARYDPAVLDMLLPLLMFIEHGQVVERRVALCDLLPGMVLTRDVMHPDGFLLLARSAVLTRSLIDALRMLQDNTGITPDVRILLERIEAPGLPSVAAHGG